MVMTEKEQILARLAWIRASLGEVYVDLEMLYERLERIDIRVGRSKAGTPGKSPGATAPNAEPTSVSKSAFERLLCDESGYEDVDKGEG